MENVILINDLISLTAFEAGDRANLIRYINDPDVYNNTLTIPSPYTDIHADEWFVRVQEQRDKYGMISSWAIRHREAGLIGNIACFFKYTSASDSHRDEIGYWLAAPFRGQGIMTGAVDAFCNWLHEKRGLLRIEAFVFVHNPASARVLEKAGFEREGYFRKLDRKDGVLLDAVGLARIWE